MAMTRLFVSIGSFLAFLAVGAGAFGTHALRDVLTPKMLDVWQTAVHYQLIHALAILLVAVLAKGQSILLQKWAGILFATGTLFFSGSLYLLAASGIKWLGAITPIGGACFLSGWICLALSSRKME
jgi:uncharacterized membrane protein YgdD (TMEM256/DUF423 family)